MSKMWERFDAWQAACVGQKTIAAPEISNRTAEAGQAAVESRDAEIKALEASVERLVYELTNQIYDEHSLNFGAAWVISDHVKWREKARVEAETYK